MKRIPFFCLYLTALAVFARDPNLLFEAKYDTYSQHADFAKGDARAYGFPESDLQLRMYPGVPGKGEKRNSFLLADTERVYYRPYGNFSSSQGTVSFWFQMVNYDLKNDALQSLFAVLDNGIPGKWPNAYYFRIFKSRNEWKDFIMAQIYYKDKSMEKGFHRQVQMYTRPLRWKKGEWHHIAVTWNKKRVCLYLDGVLHPHSQTNSPRMNEESKPIPYDHPTRSMDDFEIPPITKKSYMFIGNYFKPAGNADKTAFDDLQIFDRPLSAGEIKKIYEEVVPPKKIQTALNFVGIPFSTVPERAARCFLQFPMGKPAIKFNAYADLCRDQENLYVTFHSDRLCMVKKTMEHDGRLWDNDSFEIHLTSPDNNYYQFIVDGNGSVFDSKNKDKGWNAEGVKSDIRLGKDGWTAQLTIPLKNLGSLKGNWHFDVCAAAVTGSKKNYYRWSNKAHDGQFTATGEMCFLPKGHWFTVERLGNLEGGRLDLKIAASEKVKVSASYLPQNGYRSTYPGDLKKAPWQATLPAGEQALDIKAAVGKQLLYRYHLDYYVNFPMEISFNTCKERKVIEIDIDFANAGGEKLSQISAKGINGEIFLKDSSGKIMSKGEFRTKTPQCKAKIDFPDKLSTGTYLLTASAGDMSRTVSYRVPDLKPYQLKISLDSNIPDPWTAIQESGKNAFTVWNREYRFDGESPFPLQIVADGTNLLLRRPVLSMNGKNAKWEKWKITDKRGDRYCFAGRGVVDGIPVAYESELWFDGMYLFKWTLSPRKKHLIGDMKITYRMPKEGAEYAYNPELVPWKNGKVSISLLPDNAARKNNVIWLSGFDRGLFFWVKSNANWVNRPGEFPLTAERHEKHTDVSLNIITRPAELAGKAEYVMVFQATPSRPLPQNFRELNYVSHGRCSEGKYELGNTGCGQDRPRIDDASVFNGCYPRDFAEFAKHNANRKVKNHMYTTPGHLSDYAPDFDYWDRKNISKPGSMFLGKKLGVNQMSYLFCSNATDAPADLWSWWCDDAMKRLKNYNGLYFDIAAVRYCESTEHGCAGVDAFGQKFVSNDALGLRNFFMRCYKTCHRNGGDMMIHCHLAYMPMTHITDFFAPGENTCSLCRANYEFGYCEGITPEEYQTDYNQYRCGVAFKFILQNGRAVALTPSMKHLRFREDIPMTLHALTPMVVHDISVWGHYACEPIIDKLWKVYREVGLGRAEFHPYWRTDALSSTSPRTYASWYRWKNPDAPYKVMIAAGNFTRNRQKVGLKVNFEKMGIDVSKATFRDLWNNKAITLEELEQFELEGGTFMLIGVRSRN